MFLNSTEIRQHCMSHGKKNYFSFLHLCLAVESLDVSNFPPPPGRVPSERFWVDSVREGMTDGKHTYTLHNETVDEPIRSPRTASNVPLGALKKILQNYFSFSRIRVDLEGFKSYDRLTTVSLAARNTRHVYQCEYLDELL